MSRLGRFVTSSRQFDPIGGMVSRYMRPLIRPQMDIPAALRPSIPLVLQSRCRSRIRYKAVFDENGERVDKGTKLRELKNEMDFNRTMINRKERTVTNQVSPKNKIQTASIEEDDDDKTSQRDEFSNDYKVPRYVKIKPWETNNPELTNLAKIFSNKRIRKENDKVIMEGTRLINDALAAGLTPDILLFSRISLLRDLNLHTTQGSDKKCDCYHVPYNKMQMWSDLTTPTGIMAAFSKSNVVNMIQEKQRQSKHLPITLICDNIRTPDNLGAVLRVAAGAGAHQVILLKGCVDVWSNKVLRAAAGAHFQILMVDGVGWEEVEGHLPDYPHVVLADLVHQPQRNISDRERELALQELEQRYSVSGIAHHKGHDDKEEKSKSPPQTQDADSHHDLSMSSHSAEADNSPDMAYLDPELTELYRRIPVDTQTYSEFTLRPGCRHSVVVVGGETEGVSNAAYRFCHKFGGSRLYIPLLNNVNSLNVASATSVVMFKVQEVHLNQLNDKSNS